MTQANGASVAAQALKQLGIDVAFGIPGTHNTELYDALDRIGIRCVLVGDERSAAFMADGAARVLGRPQALLLVPGAGLTHALSGIAEAFMDSVPMLVIASGVRSDTGNAFQLHAIDQVAVARPVVKAVYSVEKAADLYSHLARAYQTAIEGEPGPVLVDIPANFLLLGVDDFPLERPAEGVLPWDAAAFEEAVGVLQSAKRIGLYVGQGCQHAAKEVAELAHRMNAPVSWTLSGSGVYPADGPNAVWCGFGNSAPEFAREIFQNVDVLLAIGCKFGEVATGSYGLTMPERLVHVDINPQVFSKNYQAQVAVQADAKVFLDKLLQRLQAPKADASERKSYASKRGDYLKSRLSSPNADLVSPERFFLELRRLLPRDGVMAVDSGNHTFLAMENFPFLEPQTFIGPFDFSCMGYGLPAAIGAKLARPDKQVVAVVGDGGFLMTGLEVLTAVREGLGLPIFVFLDGSLGQIAQFQKVPLNRTTCTELGEFRLRGMAQAAGADYVELRNDQGLTEGLERIFRHAEEGRTVLVGVRVDYSRKSAFTQGVVKTNLKRLASEDRWRILTRALVRHTLDKGPRTQRVSHPEKPQDLGRVLIVGQGAIGASLSAKWAKAGATFTAVEKHPALAKLLNDKGVLLDGPWGNFQVRYPVLNQLPDGDVFDTIFLITKTYDTQQALEEILPHLAPDGVVVALQNGIHTETLTRLIPERQLIGGVIEYSAVHLGEGQVSIKSPNSRILLGRVDGSVDGQLTAVAAFLGQACPAEVTTNLTGHLWTKLLVNSFLNPLGALLDAPFGTLLKDPQVLPVCFRLITEGVAVASAAGVKLEKLKDKLPPALLTDSSWFRVLRPLVFKAMAKEIAQVRSSMWQDFQAGRPTEIDFLNGHVVRIGKRHGIACPTHESIIRLVKEREQSGRERSRQELLGALTSR